MDGPDHNPRFRASVVVNGVTFDTSFASTSSKDAHNEAVKIASLHFTCASSGFHKSLKEAELADAPAPFVSLSPDTFQEANF
ncbi:hypothetical protein RJ639_029904 [Escallonia herrerae]|uniref:DRBM domain-containing protein n=1 Tax=Escallonia herrerae TaxID=1293975 RepID=A0AA89BH07_9ASTE|nr:hypothetical protein RJ639_029904 [Escallonia herrerae]